MTAKAPPSPTRSGWKRLSYTVHGLGDRRVDMPFVILVVAGLSGHSQKDMPKLKERRVRHLDADNFNDVMQASGPTLRLEVPNVLAGPSEGGTIVVSLTFKDMDAFRPEAIASQVPDIVALMLLRQKLAPLVLRLEIHPEIAQKLLSAADSSAASATEHDAAADALQAYLRGLDASQRGQLCATMLDKMEDIDQRLSSQLNSIYHHPDFQRLEATWRGLSYLAREVESSDLLQLRVLNASVSELTRDFKVACEFDRSTLFKRGYEEAAGTFGDVPISLFVCDLELDNSPQSNYLAAQLSHVAAASWAPMLLGSAPSMFGLDDWSELRLPRDLSKIFDTVEYTEWRALRAAPDSSYLAVVGPTLLARVPWNTSEAIAEHGIAYREACDEIGHYLWMNGAFGMAALMANAFVRDGWCADLRGPIWGRIDGLPAHHVVVDDRSIETIGPVAVDLPDRRHDELHKLGISSIARHVRGDFAAMPAPRVFGTAGPARHTSASDSSSGTENQLEQVLCRCRIAQAIQCFLRDHIGAWPDHEHAAQAVQTWLAQYCVDGALDQGRESHPEPLAPLASVRVVPSKNQQGLDVELVMNYVPGPDVVRTMLLLGLPVERLSSRIIP